MRLDTASISRRELLKTAAAAGLGGALGRGAGPLAWAAGAPTLRRGGTLRVGYIANAHSFDPHYSVEFSERHVMYCVYNTIVAVSPSFEIVPELARSWKIEPNGKVITFELQPGVKFHDGTACDAAAVKWNVDFMLDPANNSPQRRQIEPFVAGAEVAGPTTLVMRLKQVYPGFSPRSRSGPGSSCRPPPGRNTGKTSAATPSGPGRSSSPSGSRTIT